MSRYAALLCDAAGIPMKQRARISIGGFLHDLGKVAVPDAILRKHGALDEGELAIMRIHPHVGARLLAAHPLGEIAEDVVLSPHERPEGLGYPRGLVLARIPLAARVVGVCDAFDAMTSSRPYRKGMPVAEGLEIIASQLGRQFDDSLGGYPISLGNHGLLDHIAGHSDDGIPLQSCIVCGPTLVIGREQSVGEHVFCRSCGGCYRLTNDHDGERFAVVPTGERGTAADLEPTADVDLIDRFVGDVARISPCLLLEGAGSAVERFGAEQHV